jgi:hypothetical protein
MSRSIARRKKGRDEEGDGGKLVKMLEHIKSHSGNLNRHGCLITVDPDNPPTKANDPDAYLRGFHFYEERVRSIS